MVDCLFLHVPKSRNYYRPLDQFTWINFLPMGLLGLADFLQQHQISAEIVHTGVEWIENQHFSILGYVKERAPRIIAIDLHWHHQSFDVINVARELKAALPNAYILLGGFTASFFHEEIMRDFDAIDGIIRGEAEVPLLELARALLQKKDDFFSVPNLSWRMKGRVLINPLSYVASEKDLDRLSFTHFSLLKNYPTYIRYIGQPFYVKGLSKKKNARICSPGVAAYHLNVGRGCPVRCTWCSGSLSSQETITGRKEVTFRAREKVLQSVLEAKTNGYEALHVCFDPYPQSPGYFLDLFAGIRREKVEIECRFDSFGLPTIDFIQSFKETFPGPRSVIALSPDVGSERLRRIHKGYPYTNRALMECLDEMKRHGIIVDLSFTFGVPFEKEEDFHLTKRLQKQIRARYSNVGRIRTLSMEMEPGSPWHLDPEAYHTRTVLRSFHDFYHYHSGEESPFSSTGYWIPDYFPGVENEASFLEAWRSMKCRHFCSMPPDAVRRLSPFWGRRLCDLSRLFWKIRHVG
ncbi:MAG: hypothetical protein A2170_05130 [Deltaproteobacteria bacterium RBG_13_53_10]|nr:MAG: hypothetical protein A2170_05130 [Deltaproteobacteria bacterium RBG_13_53_10]